MDHFDGHELFEDLANGRQFSESEAQIIIRQVLDALSYLHTNNIVHRDLKPQNVLLSDTCKMIKVIDFNVSRKYSPQTAKLLTQTGNLENRAPEIFANSGYDEKVDVWSTGLILFHILTGQ